MKIVRENIKELLRVHTFSPNITRMKLQNAAMCFKTHSSISIFTWQVPHVSTLDVINYLQLVVQHHFRDPLLPLSGLEDIVLVGEPPDVLCVVLYCLARHSGKSIVFKGTKLLTRSSSLGFVTEYVRFIHPEMHRIF